MNLWGPLMAARIAVPGDRRHYTNEGTVLSLIRIVLNASGPLGLMAIGLTVFLSYGVWGRLERLEQTQQRILEAMQRANINMASFVAANTEMNRERAQLMAQQVKLLRQLCINAAERDSDAKLCTE